MTQETRPDPALQSAPVSAAPVSTAPVSTAPSGAAPASAWPDGTSNDGASNDGTSNDGTSNDGTSNDGTSNDGTSNDTAREELRAKLTAAIPWWYSPWVHLAFPSLVGIALVAAAILSIHDLQLWQLGFVPLVYVFANFSEWTAHRILLHRRTWPLHVLYDRHTPEHHRVFIAGDLAIRTVKEFRLVLIPAYGVLTIFLVTFPGTLGLWLAGQTNLAALFVVTTMGYTLSYEWLHLSYHLPTTSFVGRRALVAVLRRHHETHHRLDLMQRWNFNVTVPLWDWVRGTIYREAAPPAP